MHGDFRASLARLNWVIAQCDGRAAELGRQLELVRHQRQEAVAQRDALLAAERTRLARLAVPPAAPPVVAASPPAAAVVRPPARPSPPSPPAVPRPPATAPAATPHPAAPPHPAVPPLPAAPSPAGRPETSVLQVQNVLLVLGGVLLGAAAITFSVVAWTTFGPAGQALILAGGTALAVAVPVLLARRGLVATAETISAVALLLVALDGFAVWSLGLFGVDRALPAAIYAGLTFLITAAIAAGYRAVARLTVPRYAALVAAQPVLPMIALGVLDGDGAAWTRNVEFSFSDLHRVTVGLAVAALFAAALALHNLVVAGHLRRTGPEPLPLGLLAWALHGVALVMAGSLAAIALAVAAAPLPGTLAAAVLLLTAALAVRSTAVAGPPVLRDAAAGAATLAAVYAGSRVLALVWPSGTVVVLAGAVLLAVVVARRLPPVGRRGPVTASAGLTFLLGVLVGGWSLVVAASALATAFPAWRTAGEAAGGPVGSALAGDRLAGWQLPVSVLVVSAAVAALLGRRGRQHTIVAGAALVAIVAPASVAVPWWVRPWVALGVALLLGLASLTRAAGPAETPTPDQAGGAAEAATVDQAGTRAETGAPDRTGGPGYLAAGAAAALGGYAFVTALPSAWLTVAVLTTLAVGGVGTARLGCALSARRADGYPARIADAALGGSLATLAGIAGSGLAALGASAGTVRAVTGVVAAGCLAAAAILATRPRRSPTVAIGAAGGALLTALANLVAGSTPTLVFAGSGPTLAEAGVAVLLGFAAVLLVVALLAAAVREPGTGAAGEDRLLTVAHAGVTLTVVASVVGLTSATRPGFGLVTAAVLTSAIGLVAVRRAGRWRRGPAAGALVAGAVLAGAGGLIAVAGGIVAVVAAQRPHPWTADLAQWSDLAASVAAYGWQVPLTLVLLVPGALALPRRYRGPAALVGGCLSLLAVPAAFGLPWWAPSAVSGAAGALLAFVAVRVRDSRWGRVLATVAALLGVHAAGAALGRPWTTLLVLAATVLVCAAVAALGHVAPAGGHTRRLADAAIGGGLAALPGVAASAAAVAGPPSVTVAAIAVATASAALVAGSVVRLGRDTAAPAVGAAIGAMLTWPVVLASSGLTGVDILAALFLYLAAQLRLSSRLTTRVAGVHVWASTLTLIVSFSRLAAVLLPGYALLTTTAVVLLVAIGVRLLPVAWRRGPAAATGLAFAAVAAVATTVAGVRALQVLVAGLPAWRADVHRWPADGFFGDAVFGWQPLPVLILLAGVVLALAGSPLVRGWGARRAWDLAAAALALAVVDAPVSLRLPWWAPAALAGAAAVGAGLAATRVRTARTARTARAARAGLRCAVVGALLGLYAAAVSIARPALTAAVLGGLVICGAIVAAIVATRPPARDRAGDELAGGDRTGGDLAGGDRAGGGESDPAVASRRLVGGAAVAGALTALPGATAALGATLGLAAGPLLRAALAVTVVGLGVAAWSRRLCPAYLPYAITAVPVGATVVTLATLPGAEPTGAYAAVACLLGVGAALLATADRRHLAVLAAAGPPALIAALAVLPAVATTLFQPYSWLGVGWGAPPSGSIDGLAPGGNGWPGTAWHPVALALLALAAGGCVRGLGQRHGSRFRPVVISCAALAALVAPIAWAAPWPAGPGVALVLAAASALWAARLRQPHREQSHHEPSHHEPSHREQPHREQSHHEPSHREQPHREPSRREQPHLGRPHPERPRLTRPGQSGPAPAGSSRSTTVTLIVLCGLCAAAGLTGALATRPTTYAGLGLTVATGLAVAALGRRTGARLAGWLTVGAASVTLLAAVAAGAELGAARFATSLAVLAVLLLLAAALLPPRQRAEAVTTETLSGLVAGLAALYVGAVELRVTALILVGYGAALGLSALRPRRRWFAVAGAGCELLAWWLLLLAGGVGVVEAYSLPAALLALLGGGLGLRRRPHLHSWLAYGPALGATFLPSLALLLAGAEHPARRLALGAGGLLVLVLGAVRRRQAPVVVGAVVVGVVTFYEVVRYWDELPRWLPMAVGGVVLIVLGSTYERRRRDLRRLRETVARMG